MEIYSSLEQQQAATEAKDAGTCACGGHGCGDDAAPEARSTTAEPGDIVIADIPQPVRHARVIGQVTALVPGESLVILAPHHPQRLLDEIDADVPGHFLFESLGQVADSFRVRITRETCC